jgi:hypothetical protein
MDAFMDLPPPFSRLAMISFIISVVPPPNGGDVAIWVHSSKG